MGGIIGMLLAAQPGSPIRRLVLNDVGATIPWSALARLKGFVRRHEPYPDLRAVARHVREVYAGFGPLTDAQWRHLTRHSVTRLEDGRYRLAYDPAIEASLWNGSDLDMPLGLESMRGINLWRHWDAIRAPVLILRGAESDVLPRDVAREMLGRGPKATLAEFPGVGHAPALMAPDQIGAIARFLLD
jgi:pimeloyl-ACP methyl ester carboxylesterase